MQTRRWAVTSFAVTLIIASAASMDPVSAQRSG